MESIKFYDLRHSHFPYCLVRVPDGRYLVLNRHQTPIGTRSAAKVAYGDHPDLVPLAITPDVASKLSWNGSTDVDRIFLYDGGISPTASEELLRGYLGRLAVLMKIKPPPPRN